MVWIEGFTKKNFLDGGLKSFKKEVFKKKHVKKSRGGVATLKETMYKA